MNSKLALVMLALITTALADEELQVVQLDASKRGKQFDGIGIVDGGGGTSVLLKDYPEPQRSQILDLVFRPKFGASVSALLVEIPGDGNSTQGSMPSHMRTPDDLSYRRGYMWWIMQEAKKRNPALTLDAAAWSAPGWIGNGNFWSQDAANYYVKWLEGLRSIYGMRLDAIGCRNEKGISLEFARTLRATLNAHGFGSVKLHAFDNWPNDKLDFVQELRVDAKSRDAIDILSAHILSTRSAASAEVQAAAEAMGKPIWDTEEHVYKKGFDCAISIVHAFNDNFIRSGATKVVNWYDIAALYPMEPYAEDPAMLLAHSPWSGNYEVREALWGYAHYGQFTAAGWQYVAGGAGEFSDGGTFVTLKSPENDYSVIIETQGAKAPQRVRFALGNGLSTHPLCVWRSNVREQFVPQAGIQPDHGGFTITLDPDSIYSLSTTSGQRKGAFAEIPRDHPFPFPYAEDFEGYRHPEQYGWLPHYFADIEEVFEIADRPDGKGHALHQAIATRPIAWAPEWKPYTIIGDELWRDYEVSASVYLNRGDTAGIMGRVNNVGTGYGTIPKGYYLSLCDDGRCDLVVVRGKADKKALIGDAEQRALIKKMNDESEGGEKVLGTTVLAGTQPSQWHQLTLRFAGPTITGLVDGKKLLSVNDTLYTHGMAGLMAGTGEGTRLSTPYYDDVSICKIGQATPSPTLSALPPPIYAQSEVADGHRLCSDRCHNLER